MSPSPTSKYKKGHVVVSTTELQDADYPFPQDASKPMLSREISKCEELLPLKTFKSENLEVGDDQDQSEESTIRQEDGQSNRPSPPTVKQILSQALNPTSLMFNAEHFTPCPKGPCFANSSQSFWYHSTAPLLSKLLSTAKYSPYLQDQYLFFFNHSILPALGPIPSPANKWLPRLTHNNSPFGLFLNFRNNKQQVGCIIEPIGPQAGSPEDQFNQNLPFTVVSSLETTKICPGLNLQLWNHFTSAFFVSASEMAAAARLSTGVKSTPTCFLEFDMPGSELAPVLKAYLFPRRRARLEGVSNAVLVSEVLRNLPTSTTNILPALEKIESFLLARAGPRAGDAESQDTELRAGLELETRGMSVEMLSFDCVDPSTARIKIYAKTHDTSFTNMRDIYTLAGRLNAPEVTQGVEVMKEFWTSLLHLPEDWDDYEDQTAEFLYFGFEIMPERGEPEIELCVPSWTCGIDKTGLTRGLSKYFKEKGWDVGSSYKTDIQEFL